MLAKRSTSLGSGNRLSVDHKDGPYLPSVMRNRESVSIISKASSRGVSTKTRVSAAHLSLQSLDFQCDGILDILNTRARFGVLNGPDSVLYHPGVSLGFLSQTSRLMCVTRVGSSSRR